MNIIVDSTFNPFTYKDLMLPIHDYKTAYELTEAAYSDLVTLTEAWKDIANREKSPEAYAMYKNYASLLNAIVDDFSQGMNPRNRRLLLGMKRRYASEITPIAKASAALLAANAFRDTVGPDGIFEVDRYNSIDDFLHGKTANNKYESRKNIVARTAALSKAAARSILNDPIITKSMSPQFLKIIQKSGLGSLDELAAAIAGNPAASNRFALIKKLMENEIGLDRFGAAGRIAVEGAINEGLYEGLNSYQVSLKENGEYMSKALRVAAALRARSLRGQGTSRSVRDNRVNPMALRSKEEISKANQLINRYIKAGYFTKNSKGQWVMTQKGKNEYYRQTDELVLTTGDSSIPGEMKFPVHRKRTGRKVNSSFRTFMDGLGASRYTARDSQGRPTVQPGNMGNLFAQYISNNEDTAYDTYHSTEYDRALDNEYGDEYLKLIKSNAGSNGKLSVVEFKDRQWKLTGTVKLDDLKGYTVSNVRYSKYGNTAILQPKDGSGTPIRVKLPAGMHLAAESNVLTAISNADDYGSIISTGLRPRIITRNGLTVLLRDNRGNILYTDEPLTPEDIIVFQQLLELSLSDMGAYGSLMVVPSTTDTEEYEPINF